MTQAPLKPGDVVRYYPIMYERMAFSDHRVVEIYPDGVPSCREPMVKLSDKSGIVLVSHCVPIPDVETAMAVRYLDGFRDGLAAFAHMRDGVSYVGTTGMTLREALDKVDRGEIWNQAVRPKP